MPEFTGRLRPPRLATAPATPAAGEVYYNTTTNLLYVYNGAAWFPVGGPSVRVLRSSSLALTNGVETAVDFTSAIFDSHTMFTGGAGTRLTAVQAGVYAVGCTYEFAPNAAGQRFCAISTNGTAAKHALARHPGHATYPVNNTISAIIKVGVGDYFQMVAYQDCGAALNLTFSSGYSPLFWAAYMGTG